MRLNRFVYLKLLLSVMLLTPNGFAQQGSGVVTGKLINGTDRSKSPSQVEIDVIGIGGGMSVIKSAVSDAAGKFRIDGLPTAEPVMLRINYKSVNYHSRVDFDSSGKASVDVEVFEPTTSMEGITLEGPKIGFQLVGHELRCVESYSFKNQTKPPKTFMSMDGNFRFSKAPGIEKPPRMNVLAPGSSMPLTQSPLESPDGRSYYSLYPLRPGVTTFDIEQVLPYSDHQYTYRKVFFNDVPSLDIGVIPQDVVVSGGGLAKVESNAQGNFTIYSAGPIKAGTEVVWSLSGGTESETAPTAAPAETRGEIKPMPTRTGRDALIIGPLLLLGFVAILWYAFNQVRSTSGAHDPRIKELRDRRDLLLEELAMLDRKHENQALDRPEYARLREQGKRQLRRIAVLLKK